MSFTSQLGGRRRIFFLGGSSLLILVLLPFLFAHFRRAQASASPGETTFRVEKKKFTQTLRLNGTTMAARSFAVLAPRLEGAQVGSMVITKLLCCAPAPIAGNQYNINVTPPQLVASTGLKDSLSQVFHFTYPAYGATLSLNLPIKRHGAEANLADALVSRQQDQYLERRTTQSISLEVTNAVHSLEQAKISMEAAKVAADLARDTLHADERKYELGAEPVFFVLDAQTRLAQAELNLIQAQISFQLAVAQLDHSTGDLLDQHHVQNTEPSK